MLTSTSICVWGIDGSPPLRNSPRVSGHSASLCRRHCLRGVGGKASGKGHFGGQEKHPQELRDEAQLENIGSRAQAAQKEPESSQFQQLSERTCFWDGRQTQH